MNICLFSWHICFILFFKYVYKYSVAYLQTSGVSKCDAQDFVGFIIGKIGHFDMLSDKRNGMQIVPRVK